MFLKSLLLLRDNIESFNSYPFSIPAIKNLRQIEFKSMVTFFVGENGTGKSTLLEAIAEQCNFNTAGGGRNNVYEVHAAEAALSPSRQLAFLKILHDLSGSGEAQFIIATHSPILMGYPNSVILNFDNNRIDEIEYEMTDHYQISKYFLNHRERLLADILDT